MTTNVNQDWNAVISSAQQQITKLEAELAQLRSPANIARFEAIRAQRVAAQNAQKAAFDRLQTAIASGDQAAIAKAQNEYNAAEAARQAAETAFTAAGAPVRETESRIAQLNAEISNAQRQLTLQANQTNPSNTNTVAAVAAPASASPGNATVATSTATTVPTATTAVDPTYTFPDNSDLLPPPPLFGPETPVGPDAFTIEANAFLNLNPESFANAPYAEGSAVGLTSSTFIAESTATAQDNANFTGFEDWRVRLSLANDADYLYRASDPGILAPLAATNGVIFPYTPIVAVAYAANYEPTSIVHSNYKIFQYTNSSVDSINITCDFTAQDVNEANYLLAVIHFFRSMTKMFYGQDENPKNGTPPPLCYMFGLGGFQFEAHPLAITGFTYSLPNDVDYIRTTTDVLAGAKQSASLTGNSRLPPGVQPGGTGSPPAFTGGQGFSPTYVPTKIQLSISCIPVISRNAISNRFSLKDYATGKLLQGTKNPGGGIW